MAIDMNMPILIVDDDASLRQQSEQPLSFSALPSASRRLALSYAREATGRGG